MKIGAILGLVIQLQQLQNSYCVPLSSNPYIPSFSQKEDAVSQKTLDILRSFQQSLGKSDKELQDLFGKLPKRPFYDVERNWNENRSNNTSRIRATPFRLMWSLIFGIPFFVICLLCRCLCRACRLKREHNNASNTPVPGNPSHNQPISSNPRVFVILDSELQRQEDNASIETEQPPPSYEQVALENALGKSHQELEDPPSYVESQMHASVNDSDRNKSNVQTE